MGGQLDVDGCRTLQLPGKSWKAYTTCVLKFLNASYIHASERILLELSLVTITEIHTSSSSRMGPIAGFFFGMPPLQALQFRTNAAVQKLPIGKVIACKNAAVGYSRGSMANHAGYVALVDSNSIIIPIAPAEQVAKTLIATYHRVRHRLVFS